MENNNLKEKIRKDIKEKIAVSNIREEFNMKEKKTKKIIYVVTSTCAMFILCIGIIINHKNELGIIDNPNVEDLAKKETNLQEDDNIIFNTGSIKSAVDISGKWADANITELFNFTNQIDILKNYDNLRQGKVYVKKNIEDTDYSKLQQYSLIYYMDGNNAPSVEIIFTKENKILQCMLPDENNFLNSTISGTEVKLFKVENFEDKSKINGEAFFEHNGYKFYIESHKIDEKDFINIIKSILNN